MDYKPKIKLSQDEFRVLASSTRIDILKLLDESQYTVSDISRKLEMNKATVHEHLTKLMEVGLVKKDDSPRKWVYYRLTWKGKNLLHPERVRVMVSLGVMLTVVVLGVLIIAAQTDYITPGPGDGTTPPVMETSVHIYWEESDQENVYDIGFLSSSALTIATVEEMSTYIETGPTAITRRDPIDLRHTREGNVIHLYDYDRLLEDHVGSYLYVEGKLLDDHGVQRSFSLRRYLAPHGLEVDLRLSALGIQIDIANLSSTGRVTITFEVENVGLLDANSTRVEVFSVRRAFTAVGYPVYGSPYLRELCNRTLDVEANGSTEVSFDLMATDLYMRGLMVFLDPDKSMPDGKLEDNHAELPLPEEVIEFNEKAEGLAEPARKDEAASDINVVIGVAAAIVVVAFVLIAWLVMSRD